MRPNERSKWAEGRSHPYDQTFEPTLDPGTAGLHRALADRDLHLRAVLRTRISLSAWFIRFPWHRRTFEWFVGRSLSAGLRDVT